MSGLSCSCDYEADAGDVCWSGPTEYIQLATKRPRQCLSCTAKINIGDLCIEFPRYKVPESDVEVRIYGEASEYGPPRASHYHCERCADLYFSLTELGYCVSPQDDMRKLVSDYADEVSYRK